MGNKRVLKIEELILLKFLVQYQHLLLALAGRLGLLKCRGKEFGVKSLKVLGGGVRGGKCGRNLNKDSVCELGGGIKAPASDSARRLHTLNFNCIE